jgi:glycosyltransferase involved in cell wall biosynthesis
MNRRQGRLAYVISEYPKVSHTFVMREVAALRDLGAAVDTISIRRTAEDDLLSEADRRAATETYSILPVELRVLLRSHLRSVLRRPDRYFMTLALSFAAGPAGVRNRLWQLFYFAEAVVLAEHLRLMGTTHLHAHFVNVACTVTMLAARLLDRPWSFTMHGPLEFDNVDHYGIPAKLQRADFVACISDYCRAQLMRLVEPEHWARLHVIHCGVVPEAYGTPDAKDRDGPVEIVSVGRLAPMKGFDVLIDAAAELVRRGKRVHVTLIGDGPERRRLEERARRHLPDGVLTIAGALNAEQVTRSLESADLFCLPSFAEGVPVVLMEAMAARLPVVATAVMGVPELVQGDAGILVPPGRADALADALNSFVDDRGLRTKAGEAGRAVVVEHFDVRDAAAALLGHFGLATPRPEERDRVRSLPARPR